MSGEMPVEISRELLTEIYRHAREDFPAECCGWLVAKKGSPSVTRVRRCHNAVTPGEHPAAPDRNAETAYVIAGVELFELSRALDGDEPPRVIYHSHPNGRAYFSATDRRVATDPWGSGPMYPVAQLVIGIDEQRVVEAKLFAWDDATSGFVEVAEFAGMEI